MDQIQDEMNRLFRDSLRRGMPSGSFAYNPEIDFKETDKAYVVKIDLPGIDKDKINVKAENGALEISGERESGREEKTKDGGLYRSERSFGSFLRTIPIPADADTQGLTAEEKQGVLTVTIPKLASAPPPRKVPVR
jgi:HSP20 family protein